MTSHRLPTWADLEQDLATEPLFPVEAPDGRKDWPEIRRQRALINELAMIAPTVFVWANANAGRRSPMKARQEGIMAGVFDITICWGGAHIAFCEFKGYTSAGRAGKLSQPQVEFGNRMTRLGFPVAAFFTPAACVEWLRGIGCPMRTREGL